MVVVSLVAGRLSANQGGYFGDSTLYALSMQMYDSIRSSVFLELRQCGLQRAEAIRNAHFDYVFRVALLSYYEVRKEKEEYRQACDRLVRYYQEMDEDSLLYETWGRLPDCLLKWGDYVEAVLFVAGNVGLCSAAQSPYRHGYFSFLFCAVLFE